MTVTRISNGSTGKNVLHLAFELGTGKWKLGFMVGHGEKPRLRDISAGDLAALQQEIAKAKQHFRLAEDARVLSCYEAGRDGFWLHRYLVSQGIDNLPVDSSSIEVNRRQRRAKSDGLDAAKLVTMLVRYHGGETTVWSIVRVPSAEAEDARQLHRELETLKDERTEHSNRIKGLLASQGLTLVGVDDSLADWLSEARLWDNTPVPAELHARVLREYERFELVNRQIKDQEKERRLRICQGTTPAIKKVRRLLGLRGIGLNGAWLLVYELFAWRDFRNGKQVAGCAGLTPTPYQSGALAREQGISKAGNRRVRRLLVELGWCWLQWQPDSALAQWYARRFAAGNARSRKVGIVALARKLVVALWKYLEKGEAPPGSRSCTWESKVGLKPRPAPAASEAVPA
jgi:transposase